jgi:hypothetical protein
MSRVTTKWLIRFLVGMTHVLRTGTTNYKIKCILFLIQPNAILLYTDVCSVVEQYCYSMYCDRRMESLWARVWEDAGQFKQEGHWKTVPGCGRTFRGCKHGQRLGLFNFIAVAWRVGQRWHRSAVSLFPLA